MKNEKYTLKNTLQTASWSLKLTALALTVGNIGCATSKINKDEVAKIQKVAIVAYTLNLPTSNTLSLSGNTGKIGASAGGSMIPQNSKTAEIILANVNKTFEKNLHWKVLATDEMKKNPSYQQAYKATMEGFQNKMPNNSGSQDYLVDGVMDKDGTRILREEGRAKLIKDLGVDAIVMVTVYTRLEGVTVMGIGSRKPQSSIHIQAFTAGKEDLVWFDTYKGDESTESVGITGFINEQKLAELSVTSVQSALSKIQRF